MTTDWSLTTKKKNYYTTLHPFNGLFQDNLVSWHQKGKPFWILLEQQMMGWQWHQLDHMQIICTSLQTQNHASTHRHNRFTALFPGPPR